MTQDVDAGRRRFLRVTLAGAGAVAATAVTARPAEAAVRAVCQVVPAAGTVADKDTVLGASQSYTWVEDAPPPAPTPTATPPPAPTPTAPPPAPSPTPAPGTLPTSDAFALHLLRRTTYGLTPELRADLVRAGGAQA